MKRASTFVVVTVVCLSMAGPAMAGGASGKGGGSGPGKGDSRETSDVSGMRGPDSSSWNGIDMDGVDLGWINGMNAARREGAADNTSADQ